jgi:hypothetical protein
VFDVSISTLSPAAYANHVQIRDFQSLAVMVTIKTEYGSIRSLAVTDTYLALGTVNQVRSQSA